MRWAYPRARTAPWPSCIRLLKADAPFPIWLVDAEADAGTDHEAMASLSAAELDRAARFHDERHGRRYMVAHAALRRLIAWRFGVPMRTQAFEVDRRGKPRLVGAPSLHFSLSYADGCALIGMAEGSEIGVDMEKVRPVIDAGELAASYFTPGERLAFDRLSTADGGGATFLIGWTRKEACVKALGHGLNLALDTVASGVTGQVVAVRVGATTLETGSFRPRRECVAAWARHR